MIKSRWQNVLSISLASGILLFGFISQLKIIAHGGQSIDASKLWQPGSSWPEWDSESLFTAIPEHWLLLSILWTILAWICVYYIGSVTLKFTSFDLRVWVNLRIKSRALRSLTEKSIKIAVGSILVSSLFNIIMHYIAIRMIDLIRVVSIVTGCLFFSLKFIRQKIVNWNKKSYSEIKKDKTNREIGPNIAVIAIFTLAIVWQIQMGRNFMIGDSVIPFVKTLEQAYLSNQNILLLPKQSEEMSMALATSLPFAPQTFIIAFWLNAGILRLAYWVTFFFLTSLVVEEFAKFLDKEANMSRNNGKEERFRKMRIHASNRLAFSITLFLNLLGSSSWPIKYPGELIGGNYPYLLSPLPGRQLFCLCFVVGLLIGKIDKNPRKQIWLIFAISIILCSYSYSNLLSFLFGLFLGLSLNLITAQINRNSDKSRHGTRWTLGNLVPIANSLATLSFLTSFYVRSIQVASSKMSLWLLLLSSSLFAIPILKYFCTSWKDLRNWFIRVGTPIAMVVIGIFLGTILFGNVFVGYLNKIAGGKLSAMINNENVYSYFLSATSQRHFGIASSCPGPPRTSQCLGLEGFLGTHGLIMAILVYLIINKGKSGFIQFIVGYVGVLACLSIFLVDFGGWRREDLGEHAITLFWVDSRAYEIMFAIVPILLFLVIAGQGLGNKRNISTQVFSIVSLFSFLSLVSNSYLGQLLLNLSFLVKLFP